MMSSLLSIAGKKYKTDVPHMLFQLQVHVCSGVDDCVMHMLVTETINKEFNVCYVQYYLSLIHI